jgi:hypothetical protein
MFLPFQSIGTYLYGCATLQNQDVQAPPLLSHASKLMIGRNFNRPAILQALPVRITGQILVAWFPHPWWRTQTWCGMTAAYMVTAWRIYSSAISAGALIPADFPGLKTLREKLGEEAIYVLPPFYAEHYNFLPGRDGPQVQEEYVAEDELEHLRRLDNANSAHVLALDL